MNNRQQRRRQISIERVREKRSRNDSSHVEGPHFFRSPFDSVPRDQLHDAVMASARQAKASFPSTLERVLKVVDECDPIYFLGAMTRAVLTASVTKGGRIQDHKHEAWEKAVKHYHIEWAQALFLRRRSNEPSNDSAAQSFTPTAITAVTDALFDLGQEYQLARLVDIDQVPEDLRSFAMLQERIRLHTLIVRNWSYYDDSIRTIEDIYSPLDADIATIVGVNVAHLCSLFNYILRRIEHVLTDNFQKLRIVASSNTKGEIFEEYTREFGINIDDENWRQFTRDNRVSRNSIYAMILAHNDIILASDLIFDLVDVSNHLGIDPEIARRVLDKFSFAPGDLDGIEPTAIFLGNPVWERPVIAVGKDRYLCVMPQLFFDNAFHTFGELVKNDKAAARRLERRRSQYLELRILDIFNSAFPDNEHLVNAHWKFGDREYESDLILRVDSQLFIVEAKAGRITQPALRGAPDRVKRHVEELIVAPALQSARLERLLDTRPQGFVPPPGIDFDRVTNVTRIAVTLEDFAAIQSEFHFLTEANLIPDEAAASVTMSISDLTCVAEILENPIELMHYLIRRKEIQRTVKYRGDELDLLGIYIQTGLNLGEVEKGEIVLQSVHMSEDIDQYFQARSEGMARIKPQRRFTQWFLDIRDQLAGNKPHRWTEAATGLMRVSLDDQQKFENKFNSIRSKLRRTAPTAGEEDSVILGPPDWSEWGFAAVALRDPLDSARQGKIQNVADNLFSTSQAKKCVVVCRPIGVSSPAYSTLAMLDRPEDP